MKCISTISRLLTTLTLIIFLAITSLAQAESVTVTTASDVVDGNVTSISNLIASPGADGEISLRESISAANNTSGKDTILFDSSLNGIQILLDTTGTNENLNVDGDLDINDADGLVIMGNGQNSTIIDGNNDERIIDNRAGDLNISGLTIRNGAATGTTHSGGGIQARFGNLSIQQTIITNNTATYPGGGIYFGTTGGSLSIINSILSDNTSNRYGGGFGATPTGGTLTIESTTITGNRAPYGGGGNFDSTEGIGTISNSIISGNTSTDSGQGGGGIIHSGYLSELTIENSEISDNSSASDGGGIDLASTDGTLSVINSTFSANHADRNGGGIFLGSRATVNLKFVTITQNIADDNADGTGDGGGLDIDNYSAPTINIHNSIVQGNDDETTGQTNSDDCGISEGTGTFNSQNGNVFGENTGCPVGVFDTIDSANLGPLQNNGGTNKTHALLVNSAAIDLADCGTVTRDQRGEQRKGSECDSGAYEFYKFPWHMFIRSLPEESQ